MRLARFGSVALALTLFGCASGRSGTALAPHAPKAPAPRIVQATVNPTIVTDPLVISASEVPAARADIDVVASRTVIAANKEEEMFVRVRVRGLSIADTKRPPINIALVVDTSGSMDGAGIERAREACGTLVDALDEGDVLSIVTFGSQPRLVFEASRVSTESRSLAKKAIAGIVADGTTDMARGLRVGLKQVQLLRSADGINRVVLLGDGSPNDPAGVTALADEARSLGVSVTALGLGPDFDETLMGAVAQRSGGKFHFVDDAAHVAKVFEQEIGRMERLVARNAWVEVTPGPGVTLDDAIGLPTGRAGRTLRIALGDITEGQMRDALIKVKLTGHRDGAAVELLDAVVHYNLPTSGIELTANKFAASRASADAALVKGATNVEIERQATRLRVADNIVRAIAMARGGDLFNARKLLDATSKLATEGAKRFDDADLLAKTKEVASLRKTIASLVPPQISMGIGRPKSVMRQHDVEASPAAAMSIRSAHGAAMDELQGLH